MFSQYTRDARRNARLSSYKVFGLIHNWNVLTYPNKTADYEI